MRVSTLIIGAAAQQGLQQTRLRQVITPTQEEVINQAKSIVGGEPPSLFGMLLRLNAWKNSVITMLGNLRLARSDYIDDIDEALALHAQEVASAGLPPPLIQGLGELSSEFLVPVLLPDLPILGPLNPYTLATDLA